MATRPPYAVDLPAYKPVIDIKNLPNTTKNTSSTITQSPLLNDLDDTNSGTIDTTQITSNLDSVRPIGSGAPRTPLTETTNEPKDPMGVPGPSSDPIMTNVLEKRARAEAAGTTPINAPVIPVYNEEVKTDTATGEPVVSTIGQIPPGEQDKLSDISGAIKSLNEADTDILGKVDSSQLDEAIAGIGESKSALEGYDVGKTLDNIEGKEDASAAIEGLDKSREEILAAKPGEAPTRPENEYEQQIGEKIADIGAVDTDILGKIERTETGALANEYATKGLAALADYASGDSQVDRTIANRYLTEYDAASSSAMIAEAQKIATNPNLSEGAKNSAMASMYSKIRSQRSNLVGQLAQNAQERAFSATGQMGEMAIKLGSLEEQKYANDLAAATATMQADLTKAVESGQMTIQAAQFLETKYMNDVSVWTAKSRMDLDAAIAAGNIDVAKASALTDMYKTNATVAMTKVRTELDQLVTAGQMSKEMADLYYNKYATQVQARTNEVNAVIDKSKAIVDAEVQKAYVGLQLDKFDYDKQWEYVNAMLDAGGEENINNAVEFMKTNWGIDIDPTYLVDADKKAVLSSSMEFSTALATQFGLAGTNAAVDMLESAGLGKIFGGREGLTSLYENTALQQNPMYRFFSDANQEPIYNALVPKDASGKPLMTQEEFASKFTKLFAYGGMTTDQFGEVTYDSGLISELVGGSGGGPTPAGKIDVSRPIDMSQYENGEVPQAIIDQRVSYINENMNNFIGHPGTFDAMFADDADKAKWLDMMESSPDFFANTGDIYGSENTMSGENIRVGDSGFGVIQTTSDVGVKAQQFGGSGLPVEYKISQVTYKDANTGENKTAYVYGVDNETITKTIEDRSSAAAQWLHEKGLLVSGRSVGDASIAYMLYLKGDTSVDQLMQNLGLSGTSGLKEPYLSFVKSQFENELDSALHNGTLKTSVTDQPPTEYSTTTKTTGTNFPISNPF